jgi:hypothetical protein
MFCLFRRHCSQMSQITLVSDQHDDDVCIGVISQFLEPSSHVCERLLLGNVVYKECSDGTSVVAVVQEGCQPKASLMCEMTYADVIARYLSCPAGKGKHQVSAPDQLKDDIHLPGFICKRSFGIRSVQPNTSLCSIFSFRFKSLHASRSFPLWNLRLVRLSTHQCPKSEP